jgi:hypothetical protein
VEAALEGGTPLGQIATATGLSKSSLSRHGRHSAKRAADIAAAKESISSQPPAKEATGIAGRPQVIPPASSFDPQALAARRTDVSPSRAQLLERVEMLWDESLDGLEAAKQPITVQRPDGASMELPGDLRARAGFIRTARDVLHMSAELSGELAQPATINGNIFLVCDSLTVHQQDPAMLLDAVDGAIDISYTHETE